MTNKQTATQSWQKIVEGEIRFQPKNKTAKQKQNKIKC